MKIDFYGSQLGKSPAIFLVLMFACGRQETYESRTTPNEKQNKESASGVPNSGDQSPILPEGCAEDYFSKNLIADKIINEGSIGVIGKYHIELDSDAHISRTPRVIQLDTNFVIDRITPELGRSKAQDTVDKLNGERIGYLLESDWNELFDDLGYQDIRCSVYPITYIETNSKDKKTIVKFSPALPYLLSPAQTAETYDVEIGDGLEFENIKAEIIESGISGYKAGSTFEGTVKISKTLPNDQKFDFEFTVESDFGGLDETIALGLVQKAIYRVADGEIKEIEVSTGNEFTPQVIYRAK